MGRLARLGARARCIWTPPLGHAYELIEYVDAVSGRWAARSRCVRCGAEQGLAVGEAKHGNVFPGNPLATSLSRQGVKRSTPPAATRGYAPVRPSAIVLHAPNGREVAVDRVRVRFLFGRVKSLYWAKALDAGGLATLEADLERALAQAAALPTDAAWLREVARGLEDELPVRS